MHMLHSSIADLRLLRRGIICNVQIYGVYLLPSPLLNIFPPRLIQCSGGTFGCRPFFFLDILKWYSNALGRVEVVLPEKSGELICLASLKQKRHGVPVNFRQGASLGGCWPGQSNVPATRPSNMNARAVLVFDRAAISTSLAVFSNVRKFLSNKRRK